MKNKRRLFLHTIICSFMLFLMLPVTVHADELDSGKFSLEYYEETYTGEAMEPEVYVEGGIYSAEDEFDIEYKDNTNAGTATVAITGKGNYEGSAFDLNFTIKKAIINKIDITITGYALGEPVADATVTVNTEGIEGILNTGITGKKVWRVWDGNGSQQDASGNFTAEQYAVLLFLKRNENYEYAEGLPDNSGELPEECDKLVVKQGEDTLSLDAKFIDNDEEDLLDGSDLRVYFYLTRLPGCDVHTYPEGEFCERGGTTHNRRCSVCGNVERESHTYGTDYRIKDASTHLGTCTVCGYENVPELHRDYFKDTVVKPTCTEQGYTAKICSKCGYCDESTKHDFVNATGHSYVDKITKATFTADGKIEPKCSACGDNTKTTPIYAIKTVSLSNTKYTYDGKAKKPTVTVKDRTGKVIDSSNYTVSYSSGRKKVGKYTVTVKFKGNYSGTKKVTFTINPPKTSIKSLKAKTKAFTLKWSKKTTEVTGYEIQYSTSSTFAKSNKTVKVTSNKTTSKTTKKLKAGKKYYVRMRTYKTVNKVKYYSDWSAKKSIKIPKK